jgi:hypothetical protein
LRLVLKRTSRLKWLTFISVCNIIVHEKCLKTVAIPCVSIAATLVKVTEDSFQQHEFAPRVEVCPLG